MEWDDLRFFLAVARLGQLSRAAAHLKVDATTVGRRVRRLEQALQRTLFEQHRDGHVLTGDGARLLEEVERMDRSASGIEAAFARDTVAGRVRVSVSEGFGTWFVAHHLPAFLAEYPGVEIDLVASSGFLSPSRRETDVAILLARPARGPLVSRKLADYTLHLYAARSYVEGLAEPIEGAGQLAAHRLIGYIPDLIYSPELNYWGEFGLDLTPSIRSSSINAQYRLAAAGAGIAILPAFIGDADATLARIVPTLSIRRSFWIVTHEETRQLPRIKTFVTWLTEATRARQARLLAADGPAGDGPPLPWGFARRGS